MGCAEAVPRTGPDARSGSPSDLLLATDADQPAHAVPSTSHAHIQRDSLAHDAWTSYYGEDELFQMSWRDGVRQRSWQRCRFEAGQNFVDGGGLILSVRPIQRLLSLCPYLNWRILKHVSIERLGTFFLAIDVSVDIKNQQ